jgi:hypothetical protein
MSTSCEQAPRESYKFKFPACVCRWCENGGSNPVS